MTLATEIPNSEWMIFCLFSNYAKRLDYDMMTIGRILPLEIRMYIVVRMDDFTPLPSLFDIFVYDLIIGPLQKCLQVIFYVPEWQCIGVYICGWNIYSRVVRAFRAKKTCKVVNFHRAHATALNERDWWIYFWNIEMTM